MFKGKSIIFISLAVILLLIMFSLISKANLVFQSTILIVLAIVITYLVIRSKTNRQTETNQIKNSNIHLINFIAFLIAILVIFITPFFQSTWFYVRHIVIFILIAFILCINGYSIGHKLIHKHTQKERTLKIVTLSMVFIGLILFGNLQLFYIKNYEIPPLYGCSYYDDYGHLIYNSQIAGSCPNLENLENNETESGSELSFSVHEEIFRLDESSIKDHVVNHKYYYDTNIKYQYDKLNRVTYYKIDLTISGYVFDEDLQEYKLSRETKYNKTIENIYEDNKLTSNHKVVNTVTDEGRVLESISYAYDVQYMSELKSQNESDSYVIEVTKITHENQELNSDLLYTIDIRLHHREYTYLVHKENQDEYLVLSVEDRNDVLNEYIIKKDYYAFIYNMIRTEKKQYFTSHQKLSDSDELIYTNDFTRSDPYISTDVDYRDHNILRTDVDDTLNQGFFNFTNLIEETEYGFKLNHYHTQRDDDFSYNTYHKNIPYSIDYPNNNLSIELQQINNYERSLYYPDFYTLELIYQDNPFLMRSYIEDLRN